MLLRYQPVIVTDAPPHSEKYLSLCEVYFDGGDCLRAWSKPCLWPCGNDVSELQGELVRMLVDSYSWVPVPYEELHTGMMFERALDMEQREGIARMVESVSLASKPMVQ